MWETGFEPVSTDHESAEFPTTLPPINEIIQIDIKFGSALNRTRTFAFEGLYSTTKLQIQQKLNKKLPDVPLKSIWRSRKIKPVLLDYSIFLDLWFLFNGE